MIKSSLNFPRALLLLLVLGFVQLQAADLTFSVPPQTNGENTTILIQRQAVSLWNIEHSAAAGGLTDIQLRAALRHRHILAGHAAGFNRLHAERAGTSGTETAISLTKSSGTSATSTGSSFVVASGKKFHITSFSVATRGHATATAQATTFSLRVNPAGAVTTSTTPITFSARSATPATASSWDRYVIPIPDGYEIAGDGTLQFGVTGNGIYVTNPPTWDVTITGFEY